jgi:hypothetical protein
VRSELNGFEDESATPEGSLQATAPKNFHLNFETLIVAGAATAAGLAQSIIFVP